MVLLDDMIDCLSEYTGKKKANEIANLIFINSGKANTKINNLDKFYSQCRKLKFSDERLDKIKHSIEKGKQNSVKR